MSAFHYHISGLEGKEAESGGDAGTRRDGDGETRGRGELTDAVTRRREDAGRMEESWQMAARRGQGSGVEDEGENGRRGRGERGMRRGTWVELV